ncbi:MAG TPA: hypothetical protein VE866_09175 [Candidatus Binatia bacterium]|jgi:hypothetical protein|nr:hypothetical protein [Candidatus Binatia bacterium]
MELLQALLHPERSSRSPFSVLGSQFLVEVESNPGWHRVSVRELRTESWFTTLMRMEGWFQNGNPAQRL